jgi:hypothetical protein
MEDGTVLRQGISNDKTVVPADVLLGDKFYFTVYGINNNERITTNLVKVNLLKSGYTDDAITPGEDELTPSVVEEIYLALDSKVSNTTFDGALEDINTQLNEIETTLPDKVDKETGKGLSTNDFSNGYRNFIDQSRTIRLNSTTNTSTTSKYVVTIPGTDFNVAHGTMVGVLNVTGDNTAGATLNVNGSGDKPMYKDNAVITMGAFPNKSFKLFVYVTWSTINGGNGAWLMIT